MMAWLRIDDAFLEHPKILGLNDRQLRVHLQAMLYAARLRTAGHVPEAALRQIRVRKPDRNELISRRLWDENQAGDGIEIHDFSIYNGDTLEVRIAAFLDSNPDATTNAVHRAVGGRKQEVLRIIAAIRAGSPTVPGNQTGTSEERFPNGSASRARARGPRPAPRTSTSAAAVARPDDDAAAAVLEQLDDLGLNGTARNLALANIERAEAWLELAQKEARTNPAAYVLAGLRSGEWPSTRGPLKTKRAATSTPCEDCGLGGGLHTVDCPRARAQVQAEGGEDG